MAYAAKTVVPVAKTQWEIQDLLRRHHADGIRVGENWLELSAVVEFAMKSRHLRFRLSLACDIPTATEKQQEQFVRSRWRALLLTIRAKLESIEAGIEVFDEAFMAQTVMPDGKTVAEHALPRIAAAYESGSTVPLLSWGGQ
jgi:hypothetical protein